VLSLLCVAVHGTRPVLVRAERKYFSCRESRYRAAFDTYRLLAARIEELTKGGQQAPASELRAEEDALWELATVRRELLDALKELAKSRH